ncbi:MAG: ABC transporter permease, partial [Pseudomonadales bacterium]|nr:ABC transporter permease [Pseudomonadales bacterium]
MNLWYEISYTLRSIRKKLGFSALCVIVIALGYAITMPIYSIVKNFAYSAVPFVDGDRLVFIRQTNQITGREYDSNSFDFFQFNAIDAEDSSFEQIGAYRNHQTTLSDGDYAQRFNGVEITSTAFGFSSTSPQLGRPLLPTDESPGSDPVAVISHFVWQNYYSGAPDIIGKQSRINSEFRTIVGVMPPDYSFPQVAEVWLPFVIDNAAQPGGRDAIAIIGMLEDGATRRQASIELAAVMERLSSEFDVYEGRSIEVTPYTHGLITNGIALFNSIGGLGVCILVLICLNVGNLLLVRTNERISELAIRNAMGATRRGLVAHILLESLIICLMGTFFGLALSFFILEYIQFLFFEVLLEPREAPFWFDFSLNLQGVVFGFGMMLFIWLASGVFTGWRSIKHDIATILSGHAKGTAVKDNGKINRLLVHIQITLSFFLLVVSGCYLFALQSEYDQAIVPDSERIVRASIDFNYPSYENSEARYEFTQNLRDLLTSIPEMESVSFGSAAPGYVSGIVSVDQGEIPQSPGQEAHSYGLSVIDADYFQNLGIEIQQGREFEPLDTVNSEAVVIVGEGFVRAQQLGDSPLGRSVDLRPVYRDGVSETARIVGVVPSLGAEDRDFPPEIYRPLTQLFPDSLVLLMKLRPDAEKTLGEVEREVVTLATMADRDIPIYSFGYLITEIETNNNAIGFFVSLFSTAAIGALVLAVIGVYGLISRSVMARAAEIGIRRAIGSSNSMVMRIFLRQAFTYLIVGTLIG